MPTKKIYLCLLNRLSNRFGMLSAFVLLQDLWMIFTKLLTLSVKCLAFISSRKKDYINQVKPNGYRSYHLILEVETPYPDCYGKTPGKYFIEVQLRTIAMDSWASLEHQMKYKHEIKIQNGSSGN